MTDAASWSGQFVPAELSQAEQAMAFARMSDVRSEAAERQEQAERDAAREQRLETLEFANRQAGNPLGELSRARTMFAEADDEVRDLAGKLERAQARRDRAEGNMQFFASRIQQATELAKRSAPSGVEGAVSRAQEALQEQAARARVDAMLTAGTAGPPKGRSGGAGVAVRAEEQPVECPECQSVGASWEQSVLIHKKAELDGVALPQRSSRSTGPVISR